MRLSRQITEQQTALERVPHHLYLEREGGSLPDPARDAAPVWSVPRLVAAWIALGLFGGMIEVASRSLIRHFDPRIASAESALNLHWPWMVPLAWVTIFGVLGLFVGGLGCIWPRVAFWLGSRLSIALVALGSLLALKGLHVVSALLLAAGCGGVFGRCLRHDARRMRRLARVLLPTLVSIEIGIIALHGGHVWTAESRGLATLPPPHSGAPNVLFIVLDTVRAKSLSLHGYERGTSPNLDALARRGAWFQNARSPGNWTLPSHASMFTGKWPHELSAGPDTPLDASYPTLAEVMRDQGYATAAFSANIYYANAAFGLDRGFLRFEDHWDNQRITPWEILRSSLLGTATLECLSKFGMRGWRVKTGRKHAPVVNRQLLGWLDSLPGLGSRRPFFAFLNFMDAHDPYGLPRDESHAHTVDFKRINYLVELVRAYRKDSADSANGPGAVGRLHIRHEDPPHIRDAIREIAQGRKDAYDSCLIYLDEHIGRLVAELKKRGILDSTLVIITSDHGEHFGEHGKFEHGTTLYKELIHVPLLMFGPGIPEAQTPRLVVSTRQLPASICDLANITRHPFSGPSLANAWKSNSLGTAEFPPAFSEVEHLTHVAPTYHFPPSLGPMWATIGQEFTYIRHRANREELYDLESDLDESKNLASQAASEAFLSEARRTLDEFLKSCVSPRYQAARK